MLKKSINAKDVNIPEELTNVIQNTLLKYKHESQFFLQLQSKDYVNAIIYLLLYKPSLETNKIKTKLAKFSNSELEQLKDIYFMKPKQRKYLNIAQLAQATSESFSYYEQLIKKSGPIFQQLSVNYLFEHEEYRNKIRLSQFHGNSLKPLAGLAQVKNDIILIEHQKGYFVACYSSEIYQFSIKENSDTRRIVEIPKSRGPKGERKQQQKGEYFSSNKKESNNEREQQQEEEELENQQQGEQQKLNVEKPQQQQQQSIQSKDTFQSTNLQKFTFCLLLILLVCLLYDFLMS